MKQISEVLKQQLNFKSQNAILALLFFTSLGLMVWAFNIYGSTIIDTKFIFAIGIFGGIITFLLIRQFIKSTYSKFWIFFMSMVIGSGAICFGILYSNQAFSDAQIIKEDFGIVKKGTLPVSRGSRCHQPYVIINFHGTEKQLVFYCQLASEIKEASKITLTYSEGFFHFYVIKTRQLLP